MKKQFFYAALAIGMMSSCSSNDLPGNQAPEEQLPEEERVAIELGISSPNAKIEASTRGTGAVGSSKEDQNKWSGQELKIWMIDKTKNHAKDGEGNIILDGLKFIAPNDANTGAIGMYEFYNNTTDYKQIYKYYPQTGKYSFYGYYVDDLTGASVEETVDGTNGTLKVIIDGTQDILTAQTAPFGESQATSAYKNQDIFEPGTTTPSTWSDIQSKSFSAWSARRNLVPILNFEHKLSRFRFYVKAGEAAAANYEKKADDSWGPKDKQPVGGTDEEMGVFITSLITDPLTTEFTVDLFGDGMPTTAGSTQKEYILKSYEGKNAVEGTGPDGTGTGNFLKKPVAPKYFGTNATDNHIPADEESTYVGDLMIYPKDLSAINVHLTLSQVVKKSTTVNGEITTDEYQKLNNNDDPIDFTINASEIITSGESLTSFKEGEQYDITIIVYGYQEIKVSASLSAWKDGGHNEYNPSDDYTE
ncbi:MAG: hypothetical protein ACI4C3_10105 [Bacteroides sp.]